MGNLRHTQSLKNDSKKYEYAFWRCLSNFAEAKKNAKILNVTLY